MTTDPAPTLPFNGLTLAEAERLAILAEEASEVIKVVGKVLRHGWTPTDHTTGIRYDNRAELQTELGDMANIQRLMLERADISHGMIAKAAQAKRAKWGPYLHHQEPGS